MVEAKITEINKKTGIIEIEAPTDEQARLARLFIYETPSLVRLSRL